MNQPGGTGAVPRVLVVGTGARGGIGRYERLLMRALTELEQVGRYSVDYVWRRSHPAYLVDGAEAPELGGQEEKGLPAFVPEIAHAVWKSRPDLVFYLHVRLARATPVVRALGTHRYAITAHGDEVWKPLDPLCRTALRRADGVFAVSHNTARSIEEIHGRPTSRTSVTPLSLDPAFVDRLPDSATPRSQAPPNLLTVSRLEEVSRYKGIDSTIRALPELARTIPEFEYHVIGDGDDRAYLKALADEIGVGDRVVFHGFVDDQALIDAYARADVFVLPSLEEGFGLVFLEAMAYGMPVVAANAAAAPEVVANGETGRLVDAPGEIAQALIDVLGDPAVAQRMGEAARRRALEVFSFEAFRDSVDRALTDALSPASVSHPR